MIHIAGIRLILFFLQTEELKYKRDEGFVLCFTGFSNQRTAEIYFILLIPTKGDVGRCMN